MNKWNLIIDVERCENCNNCVIAAKDEYVDNEFLGYSAPVAVESSDLITISRNARGETPVVDTAYLIKMCNHCDNAPCMKVGGDAIRKRDDGIVIIDPDKAKGRKDIVKSCPYGAIVWNEERQLPQTWYFDAHLLDQGWTKPRCAQSCPTGVFEALKVSDQEMEKRVEKDSLEVLKPQLNTKPRVFYKNMYRYNKCFIGGSVVAMIDGIEECVKGANADLYQAGKKISSTVTDDFGEFKIDKLDPNSGDYRVDVHHPDLGSSSHQVTLSKSHYIGIINLN
tara:strand:+ start:5723 stop:6562 length:840 start_codon:yes stop_codon:yes gene_type:complete